MQILGVETFEANGERRMKVALHRGVTNTSHVPNDVLMQQKKFIKVGLSLENFRAYVGMIVNEVENFMKNDDTFRIYQMDDINEWGSFHAFKTMSEITILTASRTLQGEEVRSKLDKTFANRYQDLDGGFTPINFLFPNLPLESYRKRDRAQKAMSDFFVDILKEKQAGVSQVCKDVLIISRLLMFSNRITTI